MEKKISTTKKIIYGIVITATTITAVAVPTVIKATNNHNNEQSTNNNDKFGAMPDLEPEVEAGTLVSDLIIPEPEREGLEFKGWYKDPECTMPFADDEYVYSTTKVYAKWELAKYGISFNLPQGMSIQVLKVDGTEYTQEELSAIPHGTTLNFRINSDDHIYGTSYLYTLTNKDEIIENTYTNNEHIYSLTVEESTQISLENRFEYTATAQNSDGNNCVTITNFRNYCEADEISVPETIANMPVSFINNLSGGDLSQENTTIKTVNLSKYIENFDAEYMGLISNLESINIDADNKYLSSVQGVILQNTTTVIFAPRGSVIEMLNLPTTVTKIGDNAFENCLYVKQINFENLTNLTTIGEKAFANSGIISAILPYSISYLGFSAFNSCQNLENISITQSKELTIGYKYGVYLDKVESSRFTIVDNQYYLSYTFANCPNIKNVYWGTKTINKDGPDITIGEYANIVDTVFANSKVTNFTYDELSNIYMNNFLLRLVAPNNNSAYVSLGSIVEITNLTIRGNIPSILSITTSLSVKTLTLEYNALSKLSSYNSISSDAEIEAIYLQNNGNNYSDTRFSGYTKVDSDRNGYTKFEYNN